MPFNSPQIPSRVPVGNFDLAFWAELPVAFASVTDEAKRLFAIEMLESPLKVYVQLAPVVVVVHVVFNENVNASHKVNEFDEGFVSHLHEVMNLDAKLFLNHLLQQLRTANCVGSVDFVKFAVEPDNGVSRY